MMKELGKKELEKLKKQMPELPEYHFVCMECGKEYEKNSKDNETCIYCGCGNVYCEEDDE